MPEGERPPPIPRISPRRSAVHGACVELPLVPTHPRCNDARANESAFRQAISARAGGDDLRQNFQFNIAFALALKAIFLVLALLGYASLWLAILADTGATLLVIANALRLLCSPASVLCSQSLASTASLLSSMQKIPSLPTPPRSRSEAARIAGNLAAATGRLMSQLRGAVLPHRQHA